jgi:hypothetical protein
MCRCTCQSSSPPQRMGLLAARSYTDVDLAAGCGVSQCLLELAAALDQGRLPPVGALRIRRYRPDCEVEAVRSFLQHPRVQPSQRLIATQDSLDGVSEQLIACPLLRAIGCCLLRLTPADVARLPPSLTATTCIGSQQLDALAFKGTV